jgi:hypothetical protein
MTVLLRHLAALATITLAAVLSAAPRAFGAEPGSERELDEVMALLADRLPLESAQAGIIRPRVREHLEAMRKLFAGWGYRGDASIPPLMQEFRRLREDFRADLDVHLNDQQMLAMDEVRAEVDAAIRATVVGHRVDNLRIQLRLNDEQVTAVKPIAADSFDERLRLMSLLLDQASSGRLQRDFDRELRQVDEKFEKRLQEVVTTEQMDLYHKWMHDKREKYLDTGAVTD